jgi:Fe2+ or Zn2+ uptake regulation protein
MTKINDLKIELEALTFRDLIADKESLIEELTTLKTTIDQILSMIMDKKRSYSLDSTRKIYVSPREVMEAIGRGVNTPRELHNTLGIKLIDLYETINSLEAKGIIKIVEQDNEQRFLIAEQPSVCNICKNPSISFDIHHIDGNRSNNLDENLLMVCRDCHQSIHSKRSSNSIYSNNLATLSQINKYASIWKKSKRESILDDSGGIE